MLSSCVYPTYSHSDTIPACDRRTDRQAQTHTHTQPQHIRDGSSRGENALGRSSFAWRFFKKNAAQAAAAGSVMLRAEVRLFITFELLS